MKKYIKICLMCIMVILMLTNIVYGFGLEDLTGTREGLDSVVNTGQVIIKIIRVVGSLIAVAVLVIIGIKYMIGSIEEKAQYKKSLVPYVIGSIILFGVTNLAGIIYDFAQDI